MQKLRQNCDETANFNDKFIAGDSETFEYFCNEYKNIVANAVKYKCPKNEVEDVIQDAFIKIFLNRSKYDPEKSKLATWVCSIAKCVAIDRYRSKQCRVKTIYSECSDKHDQNKIGVSIDISRSLIKNLSDQDVELVRLKYGQGLRYSDIAAYLEVPIGTVKSSIHKIKQKIKENVQ